MIEPTEDKLACRFFDIRRYTEFHTLEARLVPRSDIELRFTTIDQLRRYSQETDTYNHLYQCTIEHKGEKFILEEKDIDHMIRTLESAKQIARELDLKKR